MKKLSFNLVVVFSLIAGVSCSQNDSAVLTDTQANNSEKVKTEPHRYGGWYCPDNFGFVPVDIQKLDLVPAISNRLPTEQELRDNKSLINVDITQFPDARALKMDLPRVATIYSEGKEMSELVIVIQAIIVQGDTVVGYRFPNGGNGSAWIQDIDFLTKQEVDAMGAQPFFYSKTVLDATTADIWKAISQTDYFKRLGAKFDKKDFFSSDWNADAQAHLNLDTEGEKAVGYVGMVYGNYYLQIDYIRKGAHYSEKILIMENQENNTTELFFASGPYPTDFDNQKKYWQSLVETVKKGSQTN